MHSLSWHCQNKSAEPEPRLIFPKPLNYNPKVRVGHWFDEQQEYVKNYFRHTTEYCDAYWRKPMTTNPRFIKWDIILKCEGNTGIFPERVTDCMPNFHDNFATSYDLSYGHFPKIAPPIIENAVPPIRKVGKPRPCLELIESYGNISNYGLTGVKKEIWNCDKTRRRATSQTLNQVDYNEPEANDYKMKRWPRLRPIQNKTADTYIPLPPDHPKLVDCDPFSWVCRNKKIAPTPPNYQLDCS